MNLTEQAARSGPRWPGGRVVPAPGAGGQQAHGQRAQGQV